MNMDMSFRTLVRILSFAVFGLVAADSALHIVRNIRQQSAMKRCTETAEAVVVRLKQGFKYADLPPEYAPCFAVWRFKHPEYGPVDTPTGPYFMFSSKRRPPALYTARAIRYDPEDPENAFFDEDRPGPVQTCLRTAVLCLSLVGLCLTLALAP